MLSLLPAEVGIPINNAEELTGIVNREFW